MYPGRMLSRLSLPLAAIACIAACSPASSPPEAPAARKNVLFVLIDTLRSDHLESYGYARETSPFLTSLADDGVLFEEMTAPCSWTKPSIASLFTSLYPSQHGVRKGNARDTADNFVSDVLPTNLTTLAELYSAAGYRTFGAVRNSHLKGFMGFGRGFDVYREVLGKADAVVRPFESWLDEREGDDAPWFAYLHFLDVHAYTPPPEYRDLFGTPELEYFLPGSPEKFSQLRDDVKAGRMACPPKEQEGLRLLYDATIRHLDDVLKQVAAQLIERGEWEETLVVVTSDHGEEFFEHGEFAHGHSMADNLLRVPWIVRFPGREYAGTRVDAPATLVDVLPTLAEACGLPHRPEEFVGTSMMSAIESADEPSPDRYRYGELYKEEVPNETYFLVQSLRGRDHHFLRTWRPAPGAQSKLRSARHRSSFEPALRKDHPEWFEVEDVLYDLENDPDELEDAADRLPDVTERCRDILSRIDEMLYRQKPVEGGEVELDPETIQDLRENGYIR
ncbi:MAG: sulfatase-like hydrolase/transferase [Planctomycetota bacterium JB042]